MNLPTVSLCVFVHNDLPMLKATLLHEAKWVDQICIMDMASDDGTREFCELYLRQGRDIYQRRESNTCPELGFAEAKNAVAALASMDWVYCSGADTLMDPAHARNIKWVLNQSRADVLSIQTTNLNPYQECQPHQLEAAIAHAQAGTSRHRVFVRRDCGIDYKGYIHEEPYRGEVNTFGEAALTPLRRFHTHGWGNDELRTNRYGWMLLRAWQREPALQKYTNRWWYDEYCPQHKTLLHQQSEAYERYMKETGKR